MATNPTPAPQTVQIVYELTAEQYEAAQKYIRLLNNRVTYWDEDLQAHQLRWRWNTVKDLLTEPVQTLLAAIVATPGAMPPAVEAAVAAQKQAEEAVAAAAAPVVKVGSE